jgi:hypothetical protein
VFQTLKVFIADSEVLIEPKKGEKSKITLDGKEVTGNIEQEFFKYHAKITCGMK